MATDWTKICQEYRGLWVGLLDDEQTVIASGQTVREVMELSAERGQPHPILFRVPSQIMPYIGGIGV